MNDEMRDYEGYGDFGTDYHDGYTETNKENLEPVNHHMEGFEYNFRIIENFLELLVIPNFDLIKLQHHVKNMFNHVHSMGQTIKTLESAIVVLQKENEEYTAYLIRCISSYEEDALEDINIIEALKKENKELFKQLEDAQHSSKVKFPEPLVFMEIDADCKVEVFDSYGIGITTIRGEDLGGSRYQYPIEPGDRFHVSRDIDYERKRLGNEKGSTLEELSGSELEEEDFSINDPEAQKLWPPTPYSSKQYLEEKYPLHVIRASSFNPDYKIPEDLDAFKKELDFQYIPQPGDVKGWTPTRLPESLDDSIHDPSYIKGWDAAERIWKNHHISEEFPVIPMQFATMVDTLAEMNRLIDEEESVARYLMLFEAFIKAQRGIDFDKNIF